MYHHMNGLTASVASPGRQKCNVNNDMNLIRQLKC